MMNPAQILCIGVNHQTAPLAVREAMACTPPAADPALGHHCPHIEEWALLSTCNRVEMYVATPAGIPFATPAELLLSHLGIADGDILDHMYVYKGQTAVEHLLRVTAGLDSLVLGEPQILGQVSRAFSQAQELGSAGPVMRALFRSALATGKRVRSETGIGRNPASVPSVAIKQARDTMGSLRERPILLIGAGAMAQTAVKALRARKCEKLSIANRTPAHAAQLAAAWGGTVYGLDDLDEALAAADVVFSATHARRPLLDPARMARVMDARRGRPLLLFDLAVPRDIDAAVADLPAVTLVDIDSLRAELDDSLVARRREIPAAEAIIAEEAARLQERLSQLAMRPVIAGLRQKAETIRRRELARTLRYLGDLDPQALEHVEHLSHALVNQLLHEPTARLREEATGERPEALSEVVRDLFNLRAPGEARGANGQ